MIADKIAVMYNDEKTILRRNRDMYDLYLFNYNNFTVEYDLLMKCLRKRKVVISRISVIEKMVANKETYSKVINTLSDLLKDGERVSTDWIILNEVTP